MKTNPLTLALFSLFASLVAAQPICGDCNMDGQVTIIDALTGAQFAAGLMAPTAAHLPVCDVDDDGDIDIVDALLMAQAAAGLPVTLNCPPPPTPMPPGPGDLLVTEVMQNPMAVGDAAGEWFEVLNLSLLTLDLEGCTLMDAGTDVHLVASGGPLLLASGGHFVFSINADPMTNGDVAVDYQYATFFLGNGADEIIIQNPSMLEVVRIEWDGGAPAGGIWPDPNGASMNLDPAVVTPAAAQSGANWCEATMSWAGADFGSPSAVNESCGGGGALPPTATWRGPPGPCEQDQITLEFDVDDPDTASLDVTVEASINGGASYFSCTPAAGSPAPFDVNPAMGVPPGTSYQLVWDSTVDAPGFAGIVFLSVTVDDGMTLGVSGTSFFLENTFGGTAPTCTITAPLAGASIPLGNVNIDFDTTDPDGPDLLMTFLWSTDSGATFANACPAAGSPPPYDVNPTVGRSGALQTFIWDPLCDGIMAANVLFRLEVDDCASVIRTDRRFDIMGVGAPPPAPGEIVFNEILADPNGDANMDMVIDASDDEFVELVNISAGLRHIGGLELRDGCCMRHVFRVGTILPSGGAIVVFGGGLPPGSIAGNPVDVASSGALGLNNGGDTITLEDSGATMIDAYTWGAEGGMDQSLVKDPEASTAPMSSGGTPMALHSTLPAAMGRPFSPGQKVDGASTW